MDLAHLQIMNLSMISSHTNAGWRVYAIRALICLAVGTVAVAVPRISITASVTLFGVFAAGCGALTLAAGALSPSGVLRGLAALGGFVGLCLGIGVTGFALVVPGITVMGLGLLMAAWLIFSGVIEVGAAFALRKQINWNWILGVIGIGSVGLGAGLVAYPAKGLAALVSLLGVYALTAGVCYVALAVHLRLRSALVDGPPFANASEDGSGSAQPRASDFATAGSKTSAAGE